MQDRETGLASEITPEDIEQATFTLSLRGYDKDEVEAYLAAVAEQMRALSDESRSAYQNLGDEMGALLQHARDSADEMLREARAEAQRIRDNIDEELAARRTEADDYAEQTRRAADEHAEMTRARILEEGRLKRAEAEDEARRIIEAAEERIKVLEDEEIEARARIQTLRLQISEVADRLEEFESRDMEDVAAEAAAGVESDPAVGPGDRAETGQIERQDTAVVHLDAEGRREASR